MSNHYATNREPSRWATNHANEQPVSDHADEQPTDAWLTPPSVQWDANQAYKLTITRADAQENVW